MKVLNAYICYSCHEVSERAPRGRCRVCSSDAIYPLGWLERPKKERSRWLSMIGGKSGKFSFARLRQADT